MFANFFHFLNSICSSTHNNFKLTKERNVIYVHCRDRPLTFCHDLTHFMTFAGAPQVGDQNWMRVYFHKAKESQPCKEIPSLQLINQTLSYAKELEQIVWDSLIETLLYCEPGLCEYILKLLQAFGEFATITTRATERNNFRRRGIPFECTRIVSFIRSVLLVFFPPADLLLWRLCFVFIA